jgi:hypothetical protein
MGWREEVFARYRLMFVQPFRHGPICIGCHGHPSIGMWADKDSRGYELCERCVGAADVEPLIDGVAYRPNDQPSLAKVSA